jgi:putative hydrolase
MNVDIIPYFLRFNEFIKKFPRYDFHIHTNFTDGKSSIEEYTKMAIIKKLEAIAFTEHVRRDSSFFPYFILKVKKIRKKHKIKIFFGIEAKALDFEGQIDASPSMIKISEIVLGAVHRYPDGQGGFLDVKRLSKEEAANIEYRLAMGLLKYGKIDVLAHPGGFFETFFNDDFPKEYLREIFIESVIRKKAVEFNGKYMKNPNKFISLCKEINPYIFIGSDAHHVNELGKSLGLMKIAMKSV